MTGKKRKLWLILIPLLFGISTLFSLGFFLFYRTLPLEGIVLELPEPGNTAQVPVLMLTIEGEDEFSLDGISLNRGELYKKLNHLGEQQKSLIIDMDPERPYGEVVAVMDLLKEKGVTDIQLMNQEGAW